MVHETTTSTRFEQGQHDANALLAAIAITMVAVGSVSAIYFLYSLQFLSYRQTRTEFAFRLPLGPFCLVFAVLCVLFAYLAISRRRWLYFFPASVAGLILSPNLVWDGPGYLLKSIQPLVDFRLVSSLYMSLFAWLIVAFWVVRLNALDRRM